MSSPTSIVSKLSPSSRRQARNPSLPLRVIGCGLGRTGTNSFSSALETLLQGPVLHTGSEIFVGDEDNIRTWTAILNCHTQQSPPDAPALDDAATAFVEHSLKRLLAGYVAVTDTPIALFTPELVALYPQALFICTTRDVDSWWRSWEATTKAPPVWVMKALMWPVPVWRYLAGFLVALQGKQRAVYYGGEEARMGKEMYERHLEWVKKVVPEDRLFFFDVKQGWGPLCEILGVDGPGDGVEFPRGNDAQAMKELSAELIRTALMRWASIVAAGVTVGAMGLYYLLW